MIRVTHEEFRQILSRYGIEVSKIGSKYVYLNPAIRTKDGIEYALPQDYSGAVLPNTFDKTIIRDSFRCLKSRNNPVSDDNILTIRDVLLGAAKSPRSLYQIELIKIVRAATNYGLWKSKDLVEHNLDAWVAFYECQRIDHTPTRELPLLIGDLKFPYSMDYLAKKLKEA